MEQWIPGLMALLGVSLGAVLTFWRDQATFKRTQKLEEAKVYRERLEELVEEAKRYEDWALSATFGIAEHHVLNEPLNMQNVIPPTSKLTMLVGIYAPSLQGEMDDLTSAVNRFRGSAIAFFKEWKGQEKFVESSSDLQKASRALLEAGIALARGRAPDAKR